MLTAAGKWGDWGEWGEDYSDDGEDAISHDNDVHKQTTLSTGKFVKSKFTSHKFTHSPVTKRVYLKTKKKNRNVWLTRKIKRQTK